MDDIWTIKHKSRPGGCTSSLPYLGYDRETLLSMAARGYSLYRNGKKHPFRESNPQNRNHPKIHKKFRISERKKVHFSADFLLISRGTIWGPPAA